MRKINAENGHEFFDFNQKDKVNGNTPLHIAAELGNYKLIFELRYIRCLIYSKGKPDPLVRNSSFQTPMQV
jgi:ankyrin repeat protein